MSKVVWNEMSKSILPPTWLLIAIVVMVICHFIWPSTRVITFPWVLVGFLPIAFGTYLNLAADKVFKNKHTTVKPFQESSALVTDGVFRITRNPMYLGFVLILIGLAMLLGSLIPWIVVFVFPILMEKMYIVAEERMLAETFEETWQLYANQVRKWI